MTWTYVLVFLASFFGDVGWTMYFIEVEKNRAARAAAWSSFIVALGGFATFQYVHNAWIILPAVLGSYSGVVVTMRWIALKKFLLEFWAIAVEIYGGLFR